MPPFTPDQIKWLQDIFEACGHVVNAQTPGSISAPHTPGPDSDPVIVCPIITSHDVVSYSKLRDMLQAAYTKSLEQAYSHTVRPAEVGQDHHVGPQEVSFSIKTTPLEDQP